MSKSGSKSSDTLERVVGQYARRTAKSMRLDGCSFESCCTLLVLWFLCGHDVLSLNFQAYQAELGRMTKSMRGLTWKELVSVLKAYDEFLLNSEYTFTGTKRDFKHRVGEISCSIGGGKAFYLPTGIIERMFLSIKDHDAQSFRDAHQFLVFPTRPDVLLKGVRSILVDDLVQRFEDCESRIAGLAIEPDIYDFFPRYLSGWNPYTDFIPKLSDGSAQCAGTNSNFWYDKWQSLAADPDIEYLEYQVGYPFTRSRTSTHNINTSQFFAVPKDSTKLRGITIEPAIKAYVQQGFMLSLRRYIRQQPYLSRRIDFERPDLSAKLAQEGSRSGEFSTIDLSDASDSIRWDTVKAFVSDDSSESSSRLLEALTLARTESVRLPDDSILWLEKFGGMGNALTFTIECLVFCCIVEQGIRDAGGSVLKSKYRVYGDDIVVESRYYSAVCNALVRHGFKVNTLKSFDNVRTSFKEACGGEYFQGIDVKPIRLPRTSGGFPTFQGIRVKSGNKVTYRADWVTCYIDIANACFKRLPSVRLYIIHELFRVLPAKLRPVFTLDGSCGLISDEPSNFHLVRKQVRDGSRLASWCYDTCVYHGSVRTSRIHESVPEDAQYEYKLNLLALRQRNQESDSDPEIDEPIDLTARPRGTAWVSTLEPDYYSE